MEQPSRKVQMILGGSGGLGLAIGQGVGRNFGGEVGGWLGLGIGFAVGCLLAWLIFRIVNPNLSFGSQPFQWIGIGLLIGITAATLSYFGGHLGGVIAFWSMVGLPIVIGLGLALFRKKDQSSNQTANTQE